MGSYHGANINLIKCISQADNFYFDHTLFLPTVQNGPLGQLSFLGWKIPECLRFESMVSIENTTVLPRNKHRDIKAYRPRFYHIREWPMQNLQNADPIFCESSHCVPN